MWWLVEVHKANENIKIKDFVLQSDETFKMNDYGVLNAITWPVFMRWNFSASFFAYDGGINLKKLSSGKYELIDQDDDGSSLIIQNKEGTKSYCHSYGIASCPYGVAWLTDNILVVAGYSGYYDGVSLTIEMFEIADTSIKYKLYIYKNAFSQEDRIKLKLHWYEHRDDFFSQKTNAG
jgi:hypothetical protein